MHANQCNVQVNSGHYDFLSYMDIERWSSIHCQIKEILQFSGNKILEIGVGTGILGLMLKKQLLNYVSIDIDPELEPTYVGSVLQMPFHEKQFDVVGCFQVLEHLPYELFEPALKEIFRVSSKGVVISLPNSRPVFTIKLPKPIRDNYKGLINVPFWSPKVHQFKGEHYWEINKKNYSIKRILHDMSRVAANEGFILKRDYRLWEKPYHHFFVFEKDQSS